MDKNMSQYQKTIKEDINNLINEGRLSEAKEILMQYEEIVNNDSDIYSIKAVIAMVEGDLITSERLLLEGINADAKNFDLLYNLGYIYQLSAKYEFAIKFYKKALQNGKSEDDEDAAYEMLLNLGIKQSKQDVLESAIFDSYYDVACDMERIGSKSDAALNYGLAYRYTKNESYREELLKLYMDNETLKNIFDVAANGMKKRFVILSSCGWGDVYQRMHHMARALVKFGHEVIYITPDMNVNVSSKDIDNAELTNHSINNLRIVDGVKIYSPISIIYQQEHITNNYIDLVQNLLDAPTNACKTTIITYMPYQVNVITSLKGDFVHIYECVDDHSDLEYAFWGNKKDVIWEQELMDKADAITTTATSLFLQRTAIEGRKNVFLSRNAVNEWDFIFTGDEKIPEDLKDIPGPRICYIGAIYEWFNSDLFYEVVKSNPDKSFVIIGFGKDEILKEKYSNLYILGPKKHGELKVYLKYMDIGIIPFRADTDIIVNCDPIKHYEYLACGLPVITTFMPETAIDKINTFLVNTKEGFNKAISQCLKLVKDKEIISGFIARNSWNERAALLCRLVDNSISKNEQCKTVEYIKRELYRVACEYNFPILKTLQGMCANLEDCNKFQDMAKEGYIISRQRYVERQYLTALLQNNYMSDFIDIVSISSNVKEELKKELLYCKKIDNNKGLKIVSYIIINNLRYAQELINKLSNREAKSIYGMYLQYMLGNKSMLKEVNQVWREHERSPLLEFLQEEYDSHNRKEKIVSIIGYFGEDNIGDEALLASLLDRLKTIPLVQPVVIAFANHTKVENMHNVKAVDGTNAEEVMRSIGESDLVILGPGGLIEDYARLDPKFFFSPRGMYRYLFPVTLSQLYGKKTIGYGLGIGPLEMNESRNAVKLALSGMDKIFVRDVKSFALLEEIGLKNMELSADAVLNIDNSNINKGSGIKSGLGKTRIGISIRPFIGLDMKKLLKEIGTLVGYLLKNTDFEFVLIPMQYQYDMPVISHLKEFIEELVGISPRVQVAADELGFKGVMELISSCDLIIGMRLHSIIMASKLSIPFLAISYDPKVKEFANGVKMSEYVVDVNEVTTDDLYKKVIYLLNNRDNLNEYVSEIERQKKLEDQSWDFVRRCLEEHN